MRRLESQGSTLYDTGEPALFGSDARATRCDVLSGDEQRHNGRCVAVQCIPLDANGQIR